MGILPKLANNVDIWVDCQQFFAEVAPKIVANVKCNVQTETINTVVASVELANGCKILLYFGIVGVKFGHHWHFAEGVVVTLFVHGLVAIDKVPIIVFAVFAVFYHVLENGVVVTGVVEYQVHYYFDIH